MTNPGSHKQEVAEPGFEPWACVTPEPVLLNFNLIRPPPDPHLFCALLVQPGPLPAPEATQLLGRTSKGLYLPPLLPQDGDIGAQPLTVS